MMKKQFSLLLALMIALGAFAAFAEAPAAEDPALATVNGEDIKKSEVEALIPVFLENQYIADASDYNSVLQAMVQRKILLKKTVDLGFDQFTAEETDAFQQEALAQWEEMLAYYAAYFQSEDTEEAKAASRKQAEEMFLADGMSLESLAASLRDNAAMDRLAQYLMGDYQPGEDEVQAVFAQYGGMYEQNYQNDIPQYEYMTRYAGQSSWYTPEGYRGIVHILLKADEALVGNFNTLSARYEEQQNGTEIQPAEGEAEAEAQPVEGAEAAEAQPAEGGEAAEAQPVEPVTEEMLGAARQAVLDARKDDISMIYERLQRGESFVDLVKEYGEDPGMTDEATLAEGYPVHAQSVVYDPVFTAAAFSEKMAQPGDVSDPVVGTYGIHILMYLRDVPSGLIMTDAIHQEIEDYLLSMKQNESYGTALQEWMTKEEVVYYQEEIDKAVAAAAENAPSPEELPLEAVTEGDDGE